MRKIEFNYKFLLFLYAYLRQIDLSLDRSRWEGLYGLRIFYKDQIKPERIADYLVSQSGIELPAEFPVYFPKEIGLKRQRILALYFHHCRQRYFLKDVEIIYCYELLLRLKDLLSSDLQEYTLDVEKLRVDVSTFSSSVIESKLLNKDIQHAMSVEHYLQHKEMNSITKFMDGIDLWG